MKKKGRRHEERSFSSRRTAAASQTQASETIRLSAYLIRLQGICCGVGPASFGAVQR